VAGELEETGQRLLTTHIHTRTSQPCDDMHTQTQPCVVTTWAH